MPQLKNELAEREMIRQFRHANSWLSEVPSRQKWVNNDVIKIPVQGDAPDVLINNTVYPIVKARREDDYITLSLNKYDTTNTTVTDDELYALPYEKISDVPVQHREELEEKTEQHALYTFAPLEDSADTPVIETSGETVDGRKRLRSVDLIKFGKEMKKKVGGGLNGLVLVLTPDHVADLLIEDLAFQVQYNNRATGMIMPNYHGFRVYEGNYAPTYNPANGEKLAFGSATPGLEASVCFYKRSVAKARGTVKRYARLASEDPEMRESVMGFRLWWIGVPYRSEGMGAIVDEQVGG
jgi:hypothetical protein